MIIALAGNQNSGKTTLFNQLTGSNQHVGNFPGVTVEQKIGALISYSDVSIVDLPGIYSLSPYTSEEIVTRDYLVKQRPDAILNIVDATNIERSLYLTLQLIELQIPMVLALNMMDEVYANNGSIDSFALSNSLGIPAVPISAAKKQGLDELAETVLNAATKKTPPQRIDFCSGAVHRAIHAISHTIEDHADLCGLPARFAATKLVEGDELMLAALGLSDNERHMIDHIVSEMETEMDTDRESAMADMRYQFIEEACKISVVKPHKSKEYLLSAKIDSVLTHKIFAIPAFLAIMVVMFTLTFGGIGAALSRLMLIGVDALIEIVGNALVLNGYNQVVCSLIVDGILSGVGAVVSFLPIIVTLFFFMSILEDMGYMARVAFIMDKPLKSIGLSGRSFVPMLIGFGCTVPAIMSARTIPSEKDRKMTILLTPFMSCSAKIPIYSIFCAAFFSKMQGLAMGCLYIIGIVLAVLAGTAMKKVAFKGMPGPFVMELPNYRFPSPKSVLLLLWDKAKDFLHRAFTVIFLATIIIWFLQSFDSRFNYVVDSSNSILAGIGKNLAYFFTPLGLFDWRIATSLITGFTAKETILSTLGVLSGVSAAELPNALAGMFTPLSAFSFLVFVLLYTPCAATVATVKREYGSWTGAAFTMGFQTGFAWFAAMLAYQIGSIFV